MCEHAEMGQINKEIKIKIGSRFVLFKDISRKLFDAFCIKIPLEVGILERMFTYFEWAMHIISDAIRYSIYP